MEKHGDRLLVWGSEIEPGTIDQALKATTLPFVPGHVALMPDAHVGIGCTVGSVIPTQGAIVPSFVGVDIGCGMIAIETVFNASHLPDNMDAIIPLLRERIPAGVGQGHERHLPATQLSQLGDNHTEFSYKQSNTALSQLGTLGSGNHFAEVCLDENDRVWLVLHSGSRGIGNQLAKKHIEAAKGVMKQYFIDLDDPDLAYFAEGTPEFSAYIKDMLWAQEYARASRDIMADAFLYSLVEALGEPHGHWKSAEVSRINCHHNYSTREHHLGRDLWVTRKGAIKAAQGDLGVIPGSMGTESFIVRGRGNAASYHSSSHGAGRKLSRGQARRELDVDGLKAAMAGKTWNQEAEALLDEDPRAYKDINQVMADQAELTEIVHRLTQVVNYKGTK